MEAFEALADNAQVFMADVARTIALQQADVHAVVTFKQRLADHLQRFFSDWSTVLARLRAGSRSCPARSNCCSSSPRSERHDAAPGDMHQQQAALEARLASWRERGRGLSRWFVSDGHIQAQSELLRSKARAAIRKLLVAIATLNERRAGRSDRSADIGVVARWV